MQNELLALEGKIEQTVRLCAVLRAENNHLRQRLSESEEGQQLLTQRMEAARTRLEQFAKLLPPDDQPE